jgi:hypothetical protein
MSFVFPLLLGGLILAGIPVLLHLIMRQKPKHLLFPAFRFLLQRHRTNQRKLRLRHLLLLALRLLLIAGICLALARPKIFSERLNLSSERPVAAVLLFDSSYSMQYVSGGKSRLDEANRRALELLDELPPESRVAILDTAQPGGEWLTSVSQARDRIAELRLRPNNGPVTGRLMEAYRLLAEPDVDSIGGQDALPRFLYVFSDRTQASWDQGRVKDLEPFRDQLPVPVQAVFVDVGVENPSDLALSLVELPRQVIPEGDPVILRVTVRATGGDYDAEIVCRIDEEKAADRKQVKLAAGQSQVIVFERKGLTAGPHQAEVTLATTDSLPFNNAVFATFEVRGGRRVLILVDEPEDADIWNLALNTYKAFSGEVRSVTEAQKLSPRDDLPRYQAICLLNVRKPDHDLWEKLERYVANGGGLAIVPGGEELDPKAYNDDDAAQQLLPGKLVKIVRAAAGGGATWEEPSYQHPVMAPIKEWSMSPEVDFQKLPPRASRYWEVEPAADGAAYVVVKYVDEKSRPALLERNFDRKKVRGRVLLFTTPLDRRHLEGQDPWNDYPKRWFYLALVNKTLGYLAGDAEEASLNFQSGQTVLVPLPASSRKSTYTLKGPGLEAAQAVLTRPDNQAELSISQAAAPGNYVVLESDDGKRAASFSVNIPPEESQLSRVPAEQIENLFGAGAVLPVGHGTSLREAMQGHWSQPVELFPWIMIIILLALAVENLLANKFYRGQAPQGSDTGFPQPVPAAESEDEYRSN